MVRSSAMAHDITRGEWAGDRFDMVVIEKALEGDLDDVPWRDVTDEVVARVERIWSARNWG